VLPDLLDDGCRRRIPERIRLHDIDVIHGDTQLAEAALDAPHDQRLVLGQLRRHPGGDEGLARSDGAVVNVDASRSHRFGQTVPWFFGTELIPLYTNFWTRFPS
jgi:hypothetical protein